MGRVMGVVLTADSVSEAVVPMVVAGLRDQSGSYTTGFLLLLALALIGAIAVSFLPGNPESGSAVRPTEPRRSDHFPPVLAREERTTACLCWLIGVRSCFLQDCPLSATSHEREHPCKKQDLTPTVEPPD